MIVHVCEIQTIAQSMKTFVIIDVYVMMCHLSVTLLDLMSPLLIRDPTPIPFGNPCPPKEECIPTLIDFKTQHVQKLMRHALCKRFYDWYHPINALKYSNLFYRAHMVDDEAVGYLNCSLRFVGNVEFLYAIDMLYLGFQNGKLIDNMVQALEIEDRNIPDGWLVQHLHKPFINLLKDYIWSSILKSVEMVAKGLIREKQLGATCNSSPPASDIEPATKHPKTDDYLIHFVASASGPTSYSIWTNCRIYGQA